MSVTVSPAHQAPSRIGAVCQPAPTPTYTNSPGPTPSSSTSNPATFADQLASEAVDSSVRKPPV